VQTDIDGVPGTEDPPRPAGRLAFIGDQVLAALGAPPGLHRVQVRPLWGDFFRVNVFVGADAASAHVAASYFVQAGLAGHVEAAEPALARRY
jgi:hypothetical protein